MQGPHKLARLEGRFTFSEYQQVCTQHPNDVSRQHPNDVTMSAQLARHFNQCAQEPNSIAVAYT